MGRYCEIHIVYSSYDSFFLHHKVYRCLHRYTRMSQHALWLKVDTLGPAVNNKQRGCLIFSVSSTPCSGIILLMSFAIFFNLFSAQFKVSSIVSPECLLVYALEQCSITHSTKSSESLGSTFDRVRRKVDLASSREQVQESLSSI